MAEWPSRAMFEELKEAVLGEGEGSLKAKVTKLEVKENVVASPAYSAEHRLPLNHLERGEELGGISTKLATLEQKVAAVSAGAGQGSATNAAVRLSDSYVKVAGFGALGYSVPSRGTGESTSVGYIVRAESDIVADAARMVLAASSERATVVLNIYDSDAQGGKGTLVASSRPVAPGKAPTLTTFEFSPQAVLGNGKYYFIETLPQDGSIWYGNLSNSQKVKGVTPGKNLTWIGGRSRDLYFDFSKGEYWFVSGFELLKGERKNSLGRLESADFPIEPSTDAAPINAGFAVVDDEKKRAELYWKFSDGTAQPLGNASGGAGGSGVVMLSDSYTSVASQGRHGYEGVGSVNQFGILIRVDAPFAFRALRMVLGTERDGILETAVHRSSPEGEIGETLAEGIYSSEHGRMMLRTLSFDKSVSVEAGDHIFILIKGNKITPGQDKEASVLREGGKGDKVTWLGGYWNTLALITPSNGWYQMGFELLEMKPKSTSGTLDPADFPRSPSATAAPNNSGFVVVNEESHSVSLQWKFSDGTVKTLSSGFIKPTRYDQSKSYAAGDWVMAHRSLYIAAKDVEAGELPVAGSDSIDWQLAVEGGVDGAEGIQGLTGPEGGQPPVRDQWVSNGDRYFAADRLYTFRSVLTSGTGEVDFQIARAGAGFEAVNIPFSMARGDVLKMSARGVKGYKAITLSHLEGME